MDNSFIVKGTGFESHCECQRTRMEVHQADELQIRRIVRSGFYC